MKATYLEVCGFRSFGTAAQRLDLTAPLAVVHADNSQGKTSLAEAVEFLYTGATTRRLLLGGSPSEFQDALRNVHLPPTAQVYVELGLEDREGGTRVVRRDLTCDYRGASDCASILTVDGTRVESVIIAGLPLSDPPLAAPVLLEHTLRYAVSAKPGDRSDYFKAVLEVADLDVIRVEITALIAEREAAPRHRLLAALMDAAAKPLFAAALDPLRRSAEPAAVEVALRTACYAAAPPPEATGTLEPLAVAAERLRRALQARQGDVLPIGDLLSPPPAAPAAATTATDGRSNGPARLPSELADQLLAAARQYGDRVGAVDAATAEVLPLLQAALRVDRMSSVDDQHPAQCPLCLTPDALTAERIAAIRSELADQQQLSAASAQMQERVRALANEAQRTARTAAQAVPAAGRWDPAARDARAAVAVRLGAAEGQLESVLAQADELAALAESVRMVQVRGQQCCRCCSGMRGGCVSFRPSTWTLPSRHCANSAS